MKINSDKISRREFNSRLTTLGLSLASADVFPSFAQIAGDEYPEGVFVDVHHHLGQDLLNGPAQFKFDPIIRWMDKNSVSQTVLLSAVEYPHSYYKGRGGVEREPEPLLSSGQITASTWVRKNTGGNRPCGKNQPMCRCYSRSRDKRQGDWNVSVSPACWTFTQHSLIYVACPGQKSLRATVWLPSFGTRTWNGINPC